jgi:hypothetical protein
MLPESTFYRILRDADEQHRLARARPTLRGSATEPDHRLALPGLDLGHHLSRGAGARAVLLPLPDRRPFQAQDRRLGDSRARVGCARRRAAPCSPRAAWVDRWCCTPPTVVPRKATRCSPPCKHWGSFPPTAARASVTTTRAPRHFFAPAYRPDYPVGGFAGLTAARQWVLRFVYAAQFPVIHVGDITCPRRVRCTRREIALQAVRIRRLPLVTLLGYPVAAPLTYSPAPRIRLRT